MIGTQVKKSYDANETTATLQHTLVTLVAIPGTRLATVHATETIEPIDFTGNSPLC